jgi:hypothetical protein
VIGLRNTGGLTGEKLNLFIEKKKKQASEITKGCWVVIIDGKKDVCC